MRHETISKPIPMTLAEAGKWFNQIRAHRTIGEVLGYVWIDHFETWLVFNRGLICVDRFSA